MLVQLVLEKGVVAVLEGLGVLTTGPMVVDGRGTVRVGVEVDVGALDLNLGGNKI